MGIFSFFSREPEEDEDDDFLEEGEYEGRSVKNAATGQLAEGMKLDVRTKEGSFLFSGQVVKHNDVSLTLNRLPGALSFKVLPLDSSVNLTGFDRRLIPINLTGAVEESTRISFKVKDLKEERHVEIRESFRLPFSTPVSLYRADDEHYRNPEHCELVDISIGGCCVQSEYVHMEDEVLRIRIKLEEYAPLNFLGQVVRCAEHSPGQFRYGILFAQLTEQETTSLSKTLYNLQMGIKKTHVRGEEGHW